MGREGRLQRQVTGEDRTSQRIRRAEEFVDTHGIGNSRDENALAMFANEFLK